MQHLRNRVWRCLRAGERLAPSLIVLWQHDDGLFFGGMLYEEPQHLVEYRNLPTLEFCLAKHLSALHS